MSKSTILRNTLSTISALFLVPFIISGFYYSQPLEAVAVTSSIVVVLFTVIAWLVKGKKLPVLFVSTQWVTVGLLGLFLVSLLVGSLLDLYGQTCVGFFGSQVSCLQAVTFPVRIFILSPYVLLGVALLGLISTAQFLVRNK